MSRITDIKYVAEEITTETINELGHRLSNRNRKRLAFYDCLFSCDVLQELLLRMYDTRGIEEFDFVNNGPVYWEHRRDLEEVFNDVFLCDNKAKYRESLRSLRLAGFGELTLTNCDHHLLPNLKEITLENCDSVDPNTAKGLTCSVEEITLSKLPKPNTVRSLLQNCCSSPRLTSLWLHHVNVSATSADDYVPFLLGGCRTLMVHGCSLRLEDLKMLMELVGTRSVLAKFDMEELRMPLGYRRVVMDWCIRRTDSLEELFVGSELTGFVRLARERREKLTKRVIDELFEYDVFANMVRGFLGIRPIVRITTQKNAVRG